MTAKKFCKKYGLTEDEFYGRSTYVGELNLRGCTAIPKGFNPVVECSLRLNSLKSVPKGFNPVVGCDLYLDSLKTIPSNFHPVVGYSLYLNSLKSIPDGFNPVVGGSLELNAIKSLPSSFNPIVGWNLKLNSLISVPDGFNPVVGRCLSLCSLKTVPKNFKPLAGSVASLLNFPFTPISPAYFFDWGKYCQVDRMFTEILDRTPGTLSVKKIGNEDSFWLITDGNGNYAHGDTLKEAKTNLTHKCDPVTSLPSYKVRPCRSIIDYS